MQKVSSQIDDLEEQKKKAVENEQYSEAKQLK